ncbi:MAG TPA: HAD family hydrolase [Thermoanaerobaculia bacterium]|nr:HAD family hydrolase [Thermoanaerobaculia bacterium]
MSERREIRAVLFDIDSTILVTGGAGGAAWQRAFAELYDVEANVAERTDAGMTDPEIAAIVFREAVGREGSAEERARAIGAYLKHLPDTVRESDGYRLMPGIEALLDRLIDAGLLLGLVTGNVEAAAHIKLSRAGLNRFFSCGGYGSDSSDRTEVTEAALRRAELVSGGTLAPAACIAVGDTPRDVRAGHGAGIDVVGVATGKYSIEELREAGADWPLETVEAGFPV